MKILYIYDKYPTTYQNYLLGLLNNIREQLNIKSLIYGKSNYSDYQCLSFGFKDKIQRIKYKFGLTKHASYDIKIMANFDVIHLQHSYLWRKLTPLKKLKKKPKIVITLRGGDTYIKPWVDPAWSNFYTNADSIDAFIVMSQHQKEYLKKWSIPENKIHIIPISFGELSKYKPKYPNENKMKLIAAFRMTWEKNIEGTIQFAKRLKDSDVDFEFDIYGDGNDLGQLYYLIDRYELKDYVFPKRKIENNLLKQKMIEYDFFVQLSISESLGMSVIEAQSLGLPCVVSDSDGLPEAVLPNKTAICSDYRNIDYFSSEIIKLWKDRERYYKFSEEAIRFSNSNFTIEKEIQKTMTLYNQIML